MDQSMHVFRSASAKNRHSPRASTVTAAARCTPRCTLLPINGLLLPAYALELRACIAAAAAALCVTSVFAVCGGCGLLLQIERECFTPMGYEKNVVFNTKIRN
jgi:hypothetical protein